MARSLILVDSAPLLRKIIKTFLMLLALALAGTLIFMWLEGFSFLDALWYVFVTLATVGYGDVVPHTPEGRIVAILFILTGIGVVTYVVSLVATFVVEGHVHNLFNRLNMDKAINKLRGHMIVGGLTTIGIRVVKELIKTNTPFVAIEANEENIAKAREELGNELLFIAGDPTKDSVLEQAGIEHAEAFAATLDDDHENLFLIVAARTFNSALRIVSVSHTEQAFDKLRKVGANKVVGPATIGGLRIASLLIRPGVVNFLDKMMREGSVRFEEIVLKSGSPLIGLKLVDAYQKHHFKISVVGLKRKDGTYVYSDYLFALIAKGDTLIVVGDNPDVTEFEEKFSG